MLGRVIVYRGSHFAASDHNYCRLELVKSRYPLKDLSYKGDALDNSGKYETCYLVLTSCN